VRAAIPGDVVASEVDLLDPATVTTRSVAAASAQPTLAAKNWSVADEHVYVDDGISGAEFANRPGFLRLVNAQAEAGRSRCVEGRGIPAGP
jgi:hypothetical protein